MDRRNITRCLLIIVVCSVFTKVSSAASLEASRPEGINSSSSRSKIGEHHSDTLVYPTEPEDNGTVNRGGNFEASPSSTDIDLSPCPNGAIFCESAHDYPKDIIKRKLKKQPKLLLDILYEEEVVPFDDGNRFGPEGESEKELCTSTASIIYPNKGKSKEGLYEFIVNDDEHKQGIRVETCTNNGGECNEIPAHILPLGYKSKCVQKYILRTLVVLNRNTTSDVQGFVTKPFEFPSCCSCIITMSVSGYDRFGEEHNTPMNNQDSNVTTSTVSTNRTVKDKPKTLK